MARADCSRPAIRIKTARSRSIRLEHFSTHDLLAHIHWDEHLPLETAEGFNSSMMIHLEVVGGKWIEIASKPAIRSTT
jgi:hypothetical protein